MKVLDYEVHKLFSVIEWFWKLFHFNLLSGRRRMPWSCAARNSSTDFQNLSELMLAKLSVRVLLQRLIEMDGNLSKSLNEQTLNFERRIDAVWVNRKLENFPSSNEWVRLEIPQSKLGCFRLFANILRGSVARNKNIFKQTSTLEAFRHLNFSTISSVSKASCPQELPLVLYNR